MEKEKEEKEIKIENDPIEDLKNAYEKKLNDLETALKAERAKRVEEMRARITGECGDNDVVYKNYDERVAELVKNRLCQQAKKK